MDPDLGEITENEPKKAWNDGDSVYESEMKN
jgi:hypothetical protein